MPTDESADGFPFAGIVGALLDKHGQLDIEFDGVEIRWKGTPLGIELKGNVALSVHLRELTDDEKTARVRHTVSRLHEGSS